MNSARTPRKKVAPKVEPVPTNIHSGKRFTRNPNVRIIPNSTLALMLSKPVDCVWVVVDADTIADKFDIDTEDTQTCYILPTRKTGALRVANDKNLIAMPNVTFEALLKNGTFKIA